ncbi:glycosyltransferase family 2 protein [Ottowia caeni]|uniref:glycosyltransferase family 2 protein n=1 Tax=Ottowia caeni TaxID=2870339 RepID=UPI001E43122D|nr:glycosyltransferase family 2 protein [Ottowia caeni]
MPSPIVTVIIPTHNRPELLCRAVESAFQEMSDEEVEVIVVPNGGDYTCGESLSKWSGKENLRIIPSEPADPNAARNLGLSKARGHLIRFLDDDDYLIPQTARKQYIELLDSNYNVSLYGARIEDEKGTCHGIATPSSESDFVAMTLSGDFLALPFTVVYKRAIIIDKRWGSPLRIPEDEEWMRTIATSNQVLHLAKSDVVGVWFQHRGGRLSFNRANNAYFKNKADSILKTYNAVSNAGHMNACRKKATVQGLWKTVHGGFYLSPLYWSRFAKIALTLDPSSRPEFDVFDKLSFLPPLAIEWMLAPKRIANHAVRLFRESLFARSHIRKVP